MRNGMRLAYGRTDDGRSFNNSVAVGGPQWPTSQLVRSAVLVKMRLALRDFGVFRIEA